MGLGQGKSVTEPGRSPWSTQKDNGMPEAYSRKQKTLSKEEKKYNNKKSINPSIAKYEKQHNQYMRGRGRQGRRTMFVSEMSAPKLQFRWYPYSPSTTNSTSQENLMGFSGGAGSRPITSFLLQGRLN